MPSPVGSLPPSPPPLLPGCLVTSHHPLLPPSLLPVLPPQASPASAVCRGLRTHITRSAYCLHRVSMQQQQQQQHWRLAARSALFGVCAPPAQATAEAVPPSCNVLAHKTALAGGVRPRCACVCLDARQRRGQHARMPALQHPEMVAPAAGPAAGYADGSVRLWPIEDLYTAAAQHSFPSEVIMHQSSDDLRCCAMWDMGLRWCVCVCVCRGVGARGVGSLASGV
jgi:hypothetical protein